MCILITNFAWHVRYWRYNSFNFCRALSLENLIAAQRGCTSRSLSISASHFALFFGYFKQRVRICSIRHLCIKLFNFWFHLLCQAVYFVFSSLWHPFHPIKLTKVRVHFKERGRSDILLLTWFVWFRQGCLANLEKELRQRKKHQIKSLKYRINADITLKVSKIRISMHPWYFLPCFFCYYYSKITHSNLHIFRMNQKPVDPMNMYKCFCICFTSGNINQYFWILCKYKCK